MGKSYVIYKGCKHYRMKTTQYVYEKRTVKVRRYNKKLYVAIPPSLFIPSGNTVPNFFNQEAFFCFLEKSSPQS